MIAIGITLPTPEQDKRVAIVWLVAAILMAVIIVATGWAVLSSMSSSVNVSVSREVHSRFYSSIVMTSAFLRREASALV